MGVYRISKISVFPTANPTELQEWWLILSFLCFTMLHFDKFLRQVKHFTDLISFKKSTQTKNTQLIYSTTLQKKLSCSRAYLHLHLL